MTSALPPRGLAAHIKWRVRFLAELVRRDLETRYKGSLFSWLWPVIVQVAQLLVFTYLFAAIFRVKLDVAGMNNNSLAYGLWLFTGLLAWNTLQSGVTGAAPSILSQTNLVTKVVFPIALLPLIPVCSAFVEAATGLVVLLTLTFTLTHSAHLTWLLIPVLFAIQFFFTAGLAYLVASLTVFIRDIPQLLGPLFLFTFYLTPIVYPPSRVPRIIAGWLPLNPMSTLVDAYRDVIIFGTPPNYRTLFIAAVLAGVVFYVGLRFLQNVRHIFADIL